MQQDLADDLGNTPHTTEGSTSAEADQTQNGTASADSPDPDPTLPPAPEPLLPEARGMSRRHFLQVTVSTSMAFAAGIGVGFWQWGLPTVTPPNDAAPTPTADAAPTPTAAPHADTDGSANVLNPTVAAQTLPASYTLPIVYGQIGPQLIRAGAFDYNAFASVFEQSGTSLSDEQRTILSDGSEASVTINLANARFLLNFFWAAGLATNNAILRTGKLIAESSGRVESYASTGGWTLASRPLHAIYAGSNLAAVTPEQQARLQEAAAAIYRPCCNNATDFPDCNHGMAMLGILEQMAAQDATVDAMLDAAKHVNRFWFPEQTRDLTLFYAAQGTASFDEIPARWAVGLDRFSGTGYGQVRQWLADNGALQTPGGSQNCGV